MDEFKRSPSKIWWASESLEWQEVSSSLGSQDSGFSDQDHSLTTKKLNNSNITHNLSDNIKKINDEKTQNLSTNYKEKITPDKSFKIKGKDKSENKCDKQLLEITSKVNRNLFDNILKVKECTNDVVNEVHQYSKDVSFETTQSSINSNEINIHDSYSISQSLRKFRLSSTLSPVKRANRFSVQLNRSAPAVLERFKEEEEEEEEEEEYISSDCESEIECLFNGQESPKCTSTPLKNMHYQFLNKNVHKRIPPIYTDNQAVKYWISDIKIFYEQECMTTLQSKSIAGELNYKISTLMNHLTLTIRTILTSSQCIEIEYKNLNSEQKHIGPLAQSLTGNIIDFVNTYARDKSKEIIKISNDVKKTSADNVLLIVAKLFNLWQNVQFEILEKEVTNLVDKIEHTRNELDLRVAVTAITLMCLKNDFLIEIFVKKDIVPILLIMCEKCEGSSVRCLLLRALSTVCNSNLAVNQFEKFSGIQLVADTLVDDKRPESERSEAVALLAQITGPWIDSNNNIKDLQFHLKKIVISLTNFVISTKCCQNLLLCFAALANISSIDDKTIKYMLHANTLKILLDCFYKRGSLISIYLQEQLVNLIANMSLIDEAKPHLVQHDVPKLLLYFLKPTDSQVDIEKRLQQKSIITLSRLCGNYKAASYIVELGGVERLVKLCREKDLRYESDAILIATLATLRKIVDICGNDVINPEDAQEFIKPKLLDSFIAYSTQNESYV